MLLAVVLYLIQLHNVRLYVVVFLCLYFYLTIYPLLIIYPICPINFEMAYYLIFRLNFMNRRNYQRFGTSHWFIVILAIGHPEIEIQILQYLLIQYLRHHMLIHSIEPNVWHYMILNPEKVNKRNYKWYTLCFTYLNAFFHCTIVWRRHH